VQSTEISIPACSRQSFNSRIKISRKGAKRAKLTGVYFFRRILLWNVIRKIIPKMQIVIRKKVVKMRNVIRKEGQAAGS
jgi:hypothetical protein